MIKTQPCIFAPISVIFHEDSHIIALNPIHPTYTSFLLSSARNLLETIFISYYYFPALEMSCHNLNKSYFIIPRNITDIS